jgi:predicted GNAT family acetyltransferase
MDVATTPDPAVFAERAGDWLARKPVENNLFLVHALDPAGNPPGEKDPVFATITEDGAILGAAWAKAPYRMTLSEMPAEAAHALAEHLVKAGESLPGVNGPTAAAEAFAERWAELTGLSTHVEREQWIMQCTGTTRPAESAGRPRLATRDDQSMVAEWFTASMRDIGLPPEEIRKRSEHMVGGQIENQRLVVWEAPDGSVAAAAGWNPPLAGVVRPSGVFVSPEHRSGGYAQLVLGEVVARALESGADACVCTLDLTYVPMRSVVENVGFTKLIDVTEYRFD